MAFEDCIQDFEGEMVCSNKETPQTVPFCLYDSSEFRSIMDNASMAVYTGAVL
jgi:hypothetical protein